MGLNRTLKWPYLVYRYLKFIPKPIIHKGQYRLPVWKSGSCNSGVSFYKTVAPSSLPTAVKLISERFRNLAKVVKVYIFRVIKV
jgi:hypothetical protein